MSKKNNSDILDELKELSIAPYKKDFESGLVETEFQNINGKKYCKVTLPTMVNTLQKTIHLIPSDLEKIQQDLKYRKEKGEINPLITDSVLNTLKPKIKDTILRNRKKGSHNDEWTLEKFNKLKKDAIQRLGSIKKDCGYSIDKCKICKKDQFQYDEKTKKFCECPKEETKNEELFDNFDVEELSKEEMEQFSKLGLDNFLN